MTAPICQRCGKSLWLHAEMDYTGETDIAVCEGFMKEKEIELLPCPFCGYAKPRLGWICEATDQDDFDFGDYPAQPPRHADWIIECECRFETGGYSTPQVVADLWNTRTATAREARLVEAGRKIIEHYARRTHLTSQGDECTVAKTYLTALEGESR